MHEIKDVAGLYYDATYLYDNLVVNADSGADAILIKLSGAIQNLKENWKGVDAGIWIQNTIEVYNAMVSVRNALAELASKATATAAAYRDIQIANRADSLDGFSQLQYDVKTVLEAYSDTTDQISINPAAEGAKTAVDEAVQMFDSFKSQVQVKYDDIMTNWTKGTGRDTATEAFDLFLKSTDLYKDKLVNVSSNVTKALQNYNF